MARIKVGISSCLLGEQVRYNGQHKLSPLCTEELSRYFDYVSLCPEVGIGLGIPRKPIHLLGEAATARAVRVEDASFDVTGELEEYAQAQAPRLAGVSGYIFMQGSPSCGLHQVKLFSTEGRKREAAGRGIFARALTRMYPLLPVEEAGRLLERGRRESFLLRVHAYHDWQQVQTAGLSAAALLQLHSRYKYTLMAHHPPSYRQLGQLMAHAGEHDPESLSARYFAGLMAALQHQATAANHSNVLMHLQGYLKKRLQPEEKQALAALIAQYRQGNLPLSVPVARLRQHFNEHPDEYVAKQVYLRFYADDLGAAL